MPSPPLVCRAGWAGTGGRLLTAATVAMLAARPPHWGPHRAQAPRGPRASPDPGRGRGLGERVLVWEDLGKRLLGKEVSSERRGRGVARLGIEEKN